MFNKPRTKVPTPVSDILWRESLWGLYSWNRLLVTEPKSSDEISFNGSIPISNNSKVAFRESFSDPVPIAWMLSISPSAEAALLSVYA